MADNILLVEDDKALGYILKEYLTLHQFEVLWYQEGKEALACIHAIKVDLAILDISTPHGWI